MTGDYVLVLNIIDIYRLQFGFTKVSDVNAVFTLQQIITALHSTTVQYLSQLPALDTSRAYSI